MAKETILAMPITLAVLNSFLMPIMMARETLLEMSIMAT
jgi:hypothetical protein